MKFLIPCERTFTAVSARLSQAPLEKPSRGTCYLSRRDIQQEAHADNYSADADQWIPLGAAVEAAIDRLLMKTKADMAHNDDPPPRGIYRKAVDDILAA